MLAFLLLLATTGGTVGVAIGGVWLAGVAYDRHPWIRKILDAEAKTVPGYYTPPADLPQSYLDQIPGWDDKP